MFGTRTFLRSFLFFLLFFTVETTFVSAGEMKFLFFGASGCPVCARIKPRMDELREYGGWPITYIDAQHNMDTARQFKIRGVPTLIMLIDNKEFGRIVDESDPDVMQKKIVELYNKGRESFQQNGPVQSPQQSPQQSPPPNTVVPANLSANPYLSASVRIYVNDPTGLSTGTGTIIDTRSGEALFLTCGHIFRESKGKGPVELDLFLENGTVKVQGECIDYDDLENDLAFVKFAVPPNTFIRAIPLASRDTLQVGQNLISVGCDGGANPTIRQHNIISLDRCSTPSHYRYPFHYIQVSGAPTKGRSGGGLFSTDGYLVGVCNTGDPNSNDGHFVPLSVVRNQLDRLGPQFTAIYQFPSLSSSQVAQQAPQQASQQAPVQPAGPPSDIALASLSGPAPLAEMERNNLLTTMSQNAPSRSSSLTLEEQATVEEVRRRQSEGAEVILIINPARKGNEKVQSEIIKLENVSEKFLDVLLERESVAVGHPTLTEQAATINRRSIAAPTINRQQETGLRTQKTTP